MKTIAKRKAIDVCHDYYLFTASGPEIRTGRGKGPANLSINTYSGFRYLMYAGGMYGDPIPVASVLTMTDTGEIKGICLNEDVLRPVTIAAVKKIFREIEATGEALIDLGELIDTKGLEEVRDAILSDPGDPYGLVWQRLKIWETDNNNHLRVLKALRADRKRWEAEHYGPWSAREA